MDSDYPFGYHTLLQYISLLIKMKNTKYHTDTVINNVQQTIHRKRQNRCHLTYEYNMTAHFPGLVEGISINSGEVKLVL
jgi:hypothetical protein